MTEFIGLRAKMYALKVIEKSDTKRIKDIKKNVVAKTITIRLHAVFERCNKTVKTSIMYTINITWGYTVKIEARSQSIWW